jgi:hypothetical protein
MVVAVIVSWRLASTKPRLLAAVPLVAVALTAVVLLLSV